MSDISQKQSLRKSLNQSSEFWGGKVFRNVLLTVCVALGGCVHPVDEDSNTNGNRIPIISSLTADPMELPVGSSSTISVNATDPDNQPLTYRWSASTGDIIGEGQSVRFSASFCCAGPNLVTVTVKDNAGGSVSQSIDVFIYYP